MLPDSEDAEIKAAILASRCTTAGEIAAELSARFGPDRAWPVEMVRDEVLGALAHTRGRKYAYARDPEIMAFIAERAELVAVKQIASAGAEHFAPRRFPTSSQVHRIIQRLREQSRARAAARAAATRPRAKR